MSGQILTVAGAMFMIPLVLMLEIGVPGDIPGRVLFFGGWSMAFSMIVAAIGVFVGMNEGR